MSNGLVKTTSDELEQAAMWGRALASAKMWIDTFADGEHGFVRVDEMSKLADSRGNGEVRYCDDGFCDLVVTRSFALRWFQAGMAMIREELAALGVEVHDEIESAA